MAEPEVTAFIEDLLELAEYAGRDNRMNEAVQSARNVARKLASGELILVEPSRISGDNKNA